METAERGCKKSHVQSLPSGLVSGVGDETVIAAIGLDMGVILPEEDYGNEGLSWQKDSTWESIT